MTIYRVILATFVTAMVGFVGGVWFVGTGLAFRWIRPPAVPTMQPPRVTVVDRETLSRWRSSGEMTASPVPPDPRGGSGGLIRAERDDLRPSEGCSWEVEPHRFRLDSDWHRTSPERCLAGFPVVDPRSDQLRYVLVQVTSQMKRPIPLRVVLFDDSAQRFVAQALPGGSSRSSDGIFELTKCQWFDAPAMNRDRIKYFGIERIIPRATVVERSGRTPPSRP